MIDFKATSSLNDEIQFYNEKGHVVKSYPISELEQYVISNQLNVITESVSLNGKSQFDPDVIEQEIVTVVPVSVFIDDEWFSLCEKFYNSKNK